VTADEPRQIPVSATAQCSGPFGLFPETDIGMLHVLCGETLLTLDLLDRGRILHDPRVLHGFAREGVAHHLSTTPYLLITSAAAGLLEEGREGERASSSYALDLITDSFVWERPPLPRAGRVFVFPESGTVVLLSGEDDETFTAIDYRTGEPLWADTIPSKAVWTDGSALEIVGELTCTLDARSGAHLRETVVPIAGKAIVKVFPESGRFVVARKKLIVAYRLPRLGGEDAESRAVSETWARESLSVDTGCLKEGLCGIDLLPGARLMMRSGRSEELIDLTNGETLWLQRKSLFADSAPGIPHSSRGTFGAHVGRRRIDVIDLNTGESVTRIAHDAVEFGQVVNASVQWIDDREGLLTFRDDRGRPKTIARFAAELPELTWSTTLPSPATFRLTRGDRGKLVGLILALASVTAIAMSDPVTTTGPLAYFDYYLPTWRVRTGPRESASVPSVRAEELSPSELVALGRFRRREETVRASRTGELLFVSGRKTRFEVVALNVDDGSIRSVGQHSGEKVHSIQPDASYWLALTLEDEEKTIKMLDLLD
jgi:hypothetical protein